MNIKSSTIKELDGRKYLELKLKIHETDVEIHIAAEQSQPEPYPRDALNKSQKFWDNYWKRVRNTIKIGKRNIRITSNNPIELTFSDWADLKDVINNAVPPR